METENNPFYKFMQKVFYMLDAPVEYVRENIVQPNQKKYPWYHQKFRRVPTIDECYELDIVCQTEAHKQFERDRMVDAEVLGILRQRYEDCAWYYGEDKEKFCGDYYKTLRDTETAWFIKYGDLGINATVLDAYMKQKHRMVWERRHGPVGKGVTNPRYPL